MTSETAPLLISDQQIFAIPAHPVAEFFPMMSETELIDLAADIQANGLQYPITFDADNKWLLDGRNRREACRRAGIDVKTEYLLPGSDLIAFIVSANLKRRHLDESQRALIGARIANLGDGQHPSSANLPSMITQSNAAEMLNVSTRSVTAGKRVLAKGAPELVAAVEKGEIKVGEGAEIAALPQPEQQEIVKRPKRERKKIVAKRKQPTAPGTPRAVDWGAEIIAYIRDALKDIPRLERRAFFDRLRHEIDKLERRGSHA